jgi:hypothetical protein
MNAQTAIAVLVVLLCAGIMLRGWISFWIGLIWPSDLSKQAKSSCQSCVNGCQKGPSSPNFVELKREKPKS